MVFFAKTDIQPLINEGATKEDLAASIFRPLLTRLFQVLPVVNLSVEQLLSLVDHFTFLPELKNAFIRTLKLDDEHIVAPEHSHLFAAIGSALNHSENVKVNISDLYEQLSKGIKMSMEIKRLDPLFNNEKRI